MNTPFTKEQLAAQLDGREAGSEINRGEEILAKQAGLVVVFGYSDDNMELRGALNDEASCYDGGRFAIGPDGLLPSWDSIDHDDKDEAREWFRKEAMAKHTLHAQWRDVGSPCWAYEASFPVATFDVMEDGELWCRGIVFSLADLAVTPGDDAIATGGES